MNTITKRRYMPLDDTVYPVSAWESKKTGAWRSEGRPGWVEAYHPNLSYGDEIWGRAQGRQPYSGVWEILGEPDTPKQTANGVKYTYLAQLLEERDIPYE